MHYVAYISPQRPCANPDYEEANYIIYTKAKYDMSINKKSQFNIDVKLKLQITYLVDPSKP